MFETAPRLLAVQKYAMHQNDIQPLHQNVIQPNENKSRKTNKFPVFYWKSVSCFSFSWTTVRKEFLYKNAREQKDNIKK